MQAEFSVRSDPTAEASFAAIFDLKRLGIATAVMIKITAITTSNSMSENPLCCFPYFISLPLGRTIVRDEQPTSLCRATNVSHAESYKAPTKNNFEPAT